jgi:membrane-associated PAP2 superfamily phosphatase
VTHITRFYRKSIYFRRFYILIKHEVFSLVKKGENNSCPWTVKEYGFRFSRAEPTHELILQ